MKYLIKKNACFNCKEKFSAEEELIKVKQKGKVREWCLVCYEGYLLTLAEKKDKLNNNQLANEIPDFTAS